MRGNAENTSIGQVEPGSMATGDLIDHHAAGTAIVLSGGGAKGDFEVGAVRCLYNRGIRPRILCGTSVGSINALKLAEGEDTPVAAVPPNDHIRGLAGLEKIWLDLQRDTDMWELEPGVASVFATLKALPAAAASLQADAGAVGKETIGAIIASALGIPGVIAFAPQIAGLNKLSGEANSVLATVAATLQDAQNIRGFANYDPLESQMRNPTNFFAPSQQGSGIALRMAMVALEDGALRYVTEANVMIERNGAVTKVPPPVTAAEIAALKAAVAEITTEIADLQAPPLDPHDGGLQKPNPQLLPLLMKRAFAQAKLDAALVPMDVIRAAIASSSLPVICRPTVMQDGLTYVDGGIRTLAPIQAAIDAGASDVYVVAAGSSKFDVATMAEIGGSTPLPLLGIALRVGEQILPDEVARRDLFPANPWPVPVVVIQPDPAVDDIHDGLTIEPGLIRIRMAYGFMRAYDTLVAYGQHGPDLYLSATATNSQGGKTDEIVSLRRNIWALEFPANAREFMPSSSSLPPTPYVVRHLPTASVAAHLAVTKMKLELKTLLAERVAFYAVPTRQVPHNGLTQQNDGSDSLPAGSDLWPTTWEAHNWTPAIAL